MRAFPLLLLALAPGLAAQELVWEAFGARDQHLLSAPLVAIGDVNGDGFDDLMEAGGDTSVISTPTIILVLSGRTGAVLRTIPMPRGLGFLSMAAAGDVDGDGQPDYALTLVDESGFRTPIVELRSAVDDRLIRRFVGPTNTFGTSLLGDVDLDGDGKPDVVMTAPQETREGVVHAYDNQGNLLYRIAGSAQMQPRFQTRNTLALVGDVNGDGGDDFAVGGFDATAPGFGAFVISGKTGRILVRALAPRLDIKAIGGSVDGCGDLDGDGVPDLVAGPEGGGGPSLVAYAFSGADGSVLFTWDTLLAFVVKSGGLDFDQDGLPDVILGAPGADHGGASTGAVIAASGRDGSELHRVTGCPPGVQCTYGTGSYIEVMRPQPGNPAPLYLLAEPGFGRYTAKTGLPTSQGRLRLYRGLPRGTELFGEACRGTLARAPRLGARPMGSEGLRYHLSGTAPGSRAFLMLGLSSTSFGGLRLPLSLDFLGFRGCKLFTSVDALVPVTTGAGGLQEGYASVDVTVPFVYAGPPHVYAQWLVLGSGNAAPGALSAALDWQHAADPMSR